MVTVPKQPGKRARRTETEKAIDAAIQADGGARYRGLLEKYLPLIEDAYRQDEPEHRSHLGASLIGRACKRELWYGWRWAGMKTFESRILRLFNRGHLEEAHFLAMLEMIGVHIHTQDDGGQERISAHGGHFGSALDGLLYDLPDARQEWVLGEFKTHGDKSFKKLVSSGAVAVAKPEHSAQMQVCMHLRGVHRCFYMAVNKNDDDLYCEMIEYNPSLAALHLERARDIIQTREAPERINEDPSAFGCKFCDWQQHCHYGKAALENCRTCEHSVADLGGTWGCELRGIVLDKKAQLAGCREHSFIPDLTSDT